jgi:hypothetical protein
MKDNLPENSDKTLAAVCGIYCEACTLYIASTQEPARLKNLAEYFGLPEEEIRCFGCRSEKKSPFCKAECKMFDCAIEHGVDFCCECTDYPCDTLKKFQSEAPHRIELFDDLDCIKQKGLKQWLKEVRENYSCPKCGTLNSAYDLSCRKCGAKPGCEYVAKHKPAIEKALKRR